MKQHFILKPILAILLACFMLACGTPANETPAPAETEAPVVTPAPVDGTEIEVEIRPTEEATLRRPNSSKRRNRRPRRSRTR